MGIWWVFWLQMKWNMLNITNWPLNFFMESPSHNFCLFLYILHIWSFLIDFGLFPGGPGINPSCVIYIANMSSQPLTCFLCLEVFYCTKVLICKLSHLSIIFFMAFRNYVLLRKAFLSPTWLLYFHVIF